MLCNWSGGPGCVRLAMMATKFSKTVFFGVSQHKEACYQEPVKLGCGWNIIWMDNNGGEMFTFRV